MVGQGGGAGWRVIVRVENAPALERNSQSVKEFGNNDCGVGGWPLGKWNWRTPQNANPPAPVKVFIAERNIREQGRRLHHRQMLQVIEHRNIEFRVVAVHGTYWDHSKREQMVGAKTEFRMREFEEASRQQTSPNQQQQRNPELRHHQKFAQPGSAQPAAVRHAGGLQRFLNPDSGGG